uniref:Spaetzle domain-containing protein n=1 Tax=Anopheles atroparvus TaxID=41427 RepID=A0AAG5DEY5_ANOAO
MALVNYTLPFGSIQAPSWATASPLQNQHASAVNNLLYGPAGHQGDDQDFFKNAPYAPPQRQAKQQTPQQHSQQQQQQHSIQYRQTPRNNYLPPPSYIPPSANYPQVPPAQPPQPPQVQQPPGTGRTYGEGSYSDGTGSSQNAKVPQQSTPQQPQQPQQPAYYEYSSGSYATQPGRAFEQAANPQQGTNYRSNTQPAATRGSPGSQGAPGYPQRPPSYANVGTVGTHTQIHPVLDYDEDDEDEYYDDPEEVVATVGGISDNRKNSRMPTVTPIQGPIFVKNGTVPVVPLFAYPQVSNGTFIQIPIWWTALSVALGLSIHGDVIRGVPCIKKYHQLFCPTAGNTYPSDKIEMFIDENKALMKRMYGDFEMTSRFPSSPGRKRKRSATGGDGPDDGDFTLLPELMDLYGEPGGAVRLGGDSYFSTLRKKRQNQNSNARGSGAGRGGAGVTNARQTATPANGNGGGGTGESNTGRVDACESKIEIVTPYWATNSAGKVRAIVNTQHFEQAIHQEVCSKTQTSRCSGDCGCEQKYKWHRLLAYDPDNDCKGIFMDWFLFPSCCVCRCNP